ncbi:recombination protein RecR [Candidatus Roizmanbacteria bacterium CG_4_10_14_3_um_filter_39_13]|uniref:Recombination protein RecR n=2 Tax=Candidatus Roizmaniibacteriota TaxID=1752723 RepID=A0A2M7LK89_9BACT|nr:MAG: recombination protein RecR [Candidatus Roizmanbacteria bacterium CG03_land_8_20_14_0_80_39_12]PIX68477.1 MAG: recombination protein RecR [Candidatus Roizmanbacteria bacterium CG_4_10_14_3_um_filter_39_13]
MLPNSLKQIALFFERLPGIGEKTANRLALYLLRMPASDLIEFGKQLSELKEKTKKCSVCMNLSEKETCSLCADLRRDNTTITVIESPLDLLSFEKGNIYKGLYHVLHGRIDPLNNIGPDDIYIAALLERVKKAGSGIKEIILATNPDMEGEATAMYIQKKIKALNSNSNLKITRLAYGLPMGASVEYADYGTLGKAIENRRNF